MKSTIFLLILIFSISLIQVRFDTDDPIWTQITTVQELWDRYPAHLRKVLNALDLQQPGLIEISTKLRLDDTIAAAEALLTYFEQVDRPWILKTFDPMPYDEAVEISECIVEDSMMFNNRPWKIPKTDQGGWKWDYTSPLEDDEFGYTLNGHKYLLSLITAARKQNHVSYVHKYDRIMQDWILHHPLPADDDSIYLVLDTLVPLDYRDIGEVEWRTLETGNRLGVTWSQGFYALQSYEDFSPATRILMLSGIIDQAEYLYHYHKHGHNWTTMEMNGLALAGLAFPEFKRAQLWMQYSMKVMNREINRQVYPDGVQSEISSKTQWVALHRFETMARNFQLAGQSVPAEYVSRVEKMYDFLAYSMRPDGHQALNNDSDREDLRPRVLTAAEKFNRKDWQWIATNGSQGKIPLEGPTIVFPWAGIHIMRSGWNASAHWSFFDTGPYGTGHQHRDKLHLSIAAYGHDLLVDGGRYTHQDYFSFDPASTWRGYFRSSFSHNVILVDGQGQKNNELVAQSQLQEDIDYVHKPGYDYAMGTFDSGYMDVDGQTSHLRAVLYLHDKCWLVLDQINTDQPREIDVLWHLAPEGNVTWKDNQAISVYESVNLQVIPLGDQQWDTRLIQGQETPVRQGWYSSEYGIKVPNPTLVYTAQIDHAQVFGWILIPSQGNRPEIAFDFSTDQGTHHISISTSPNERTIEISIPGNMTAGGVVVEGI